MTEEEEAWEQLKDKITEINWRARLLGMLSIAGIWYFSSWQLTVFIVGYHVAHILGRHKNKGEE